MSMNPNAEALSLVPRIDPAPLPGPAWLFHVLWVLTFVIHLLFMNVALGGAVIGAVGAIRGGAGRRLAHLFARTNAWAISLAITFGIAPLLFLQVIHGRFFYTATTLVAAGWLSMLALLAVGYYANHAAESAIEKGRSGAGALVVEAILFIAIAAIQVAVNLLHLRPDRWDAVRVDGWAIFADPSFVPRFLHFFLASLAVAGTYAAWVIGRPAATGDEEERRAAGRTGILWALVATALQFLVGSWLLMSLPRPVLAGFMRGGAATLAPLAFGIFVSIGIVAMLAVALDPVKAHRSVRGTAFSLVSAIALMSVTRHQLREAYLAAWREGAPMPEAPQWGAFTVFLASFVLCLALAGWGLARMARDMREGG